MIIDVSYLNSLALTPRVKEFIINLITEAEDCTVNGYDSKIWYITDKLKQKRWTYDSKRYILDIINELYSRYLMRYYN